MHAGYHMLRRRTFTAVEAAEAVFESDSNESDFSQSDESALSSSTEERLDEELEDRLTDTDFSDADNAEEESDLVSEVRFYSALSFSKTGHNVLLDQRVRMNVDSLPNVSEFNSIVSAGMALTMERV